MFLHYLFKITIMKRVKLNFAIVAALLGSGAAFATSASATNVKPVNVLWGQRSNGTWAQTTTSSTCTLDTKICKEYFPAGQDPNLDASGGTVQTANGHIN